MNEFPEVQVGNWLLSTDKSKIDLAIVHHYLAVESYWAKKIPFDTVRKSISNSICLAVYLPGNKMIGFGRLVTDQATFAYLCDVFVLKPYQGKGVGKEMMNYFCRLADNMGLRRFLLTTQDAHSFYTEFNFEPFPWPERLMSRPGQTY